MNRYEELRMEHYDREHWYEFGDVISLDEVKYLIGIIEKQREALEKITSGTGSVLAGVIARSIANEALKLTE